MRTTATPAFCLIILFCGAQLAFAGTSAPSTAPTVAPTNAPSSVVTSAPTTGPTNAPSNAPTNAPTNSPSATATGPTSIPTLAPTAAPTGTPTRAPTTQSTWSDAKAVWRFDQSGNDWIIRDEHYGVENVNQIVADGSAPTWYNSTSCVQGGCIRMDNATRIINYGSFNMTLPYGSDAFTIAAWVNILNATTGNMTFLAFDANERITMLVATNATFSMGFGTGNSTAVASTSIAPNRWAHMAVTYDGTIVRWYINATLVSSGGIGTPPSSAMNTTISTSTGFTIGQKGQGTSFLLDELVIWARPLNASDLTAVMGLEPSPAPTAVPTIAPTAPTSSPTIAPTSPTSIPTVAPTPFPTAAPSTSAPTFQLLVCDPGQYTIESSDVPPVAVQCYDCPIGKYSPYGNVTVCATCSVGWSSPRKSADCVPCTAGWTSTAGGACTACPVGSYSAYGDTSCRVCAIGTYSNAAHSANCSSCAIGYYTATTNSTNCSRCEDGYTTSGVGATSCAPCAAGSYSSYNVTGLVCRQCPANTYTASAATVTCTACQDPTPYNSANSTACTDTSVAPSAAPTAAPTLHECDLGSYTSSNGACAQCAAGFFANTATATTCSGCQVGTYAPLPGLSACWSCMPGTIGVSSFATTCVDCAAGTYSSSQQTTQCLSCVAGFYAPSAASAACATCPAGKYQNATGASACVTCPSSAPFNTQDRTACANVTSAPTATPTASPTAGLSTGQTWTPTQYPTRPPTRTPTIAPSATPTSLPSAAPSRAPTTASPSYAPTVAPTISFPDSANLTGATIAAAGGVAADADLTNGTGFVPGAGWTALSSLGLSVMNLHPTQSIVITQVAAFSDTELRAYYTSTTVHSGSCGALPATASRPVAMFHVTSTTPTTIQARLSITLGDIGYTHPGRVLYLCNASTGNNGSWVVASAFVNGTGANYTDDQTTSGRDVVFATAIGHNTAYVLADDTEEDGSARCADGYHGCKCYSQHAMEEGKTSSAFLIIAAVLWGFAIVARWFVPMLNFENNVEAWVSNACTLAWLAANALVVGAVATRTSDRDPRQWVSDEKSEWAVVFVLMVVVPLSLGGIIAIVKGMICATGSTSLNGSVSEITDTPALTRGAITLISTLLGLLVIVSPSASYSGGKGKDDTNFQGLFAVSTVAAAIGLEMWVAAIQKRWNYKRQNATNFIDYMMFVTMLIDLFAVGYMTYVLALVPCGNTPQF